MTRHRSALHVLFFSAAATLTLTVVACGSSGSDLTGSGQGGTGGTARGGSTGTAGTMGAAGTTGIGGMSGAAGATGAAATGGTAGTTGVAGTSGAAGTTGTAGAAGAGGSGGHAGGGGTTSNGGSGPAGTTGAGGRGGAGGSTAGRGGSGGSGGAGGLGTGARGGAGGNTSGAGGSGGSAGAAGGYQACPSNPCKVLPLGDSITYGVNDEGNGGYRGPLFAAAIAAGQQLTFTGSLSNGPTTVSGQTFPKKNEGHSGWGISEVTPYSGGNAGIATVIPSPAFSSSSGGTPDIILLHIGTNDEGSFPASQMTSDLSGLLDKIITNAPSALVVVAQIIPLGYGTNDVIKAYNQAIPGLVQQRAAAGKHIVLVDMYTGFTPSSMLGSDNIHPNSTGYKFMADRWYSIIGPLLPK
jgi:hypothetical protein